MQFYCSVFQKTVRIQQSNCRFIAVNCSFTAGENCNLECSNCSSSLGKPSVYIKMLALTYRDNGKCKSATSFKVSKSRISKLGKSHCLVIMHTYFEPIACRIFTCRFSLSSCTVFLVKMSYLHSVVLDFTSKFC